MQVNSYICADEETKKGFILDPGGSNQTADQYIQEQGYDIEYIILTHGHGDHICGVPYYAEKYKAKLVGHHGDDFLFQDESENLSLEFTGRVITFTPDLYVTEGDIISVGGLNVKVIHTPGHTPGGISLLLDDVLFSGDTLFAESIGRTDFKNGSFPDLKRSIQTKLYVLPDATQVLPGHMGPTNIGYEKKHNMFVKAE
jgi:glyoxylase-like metal-dependent hydrolase (beta-lactamase superfamily II)